MDFEAIEEKIKNVNALTTPEERRAFCKYAKKVPNGGVIVDIGTAAGSSAFTFALASKPSVKVYTIDPNKNENFLANREEWGLEEKLVFINKTSEEAVKEWNKKIDLLFIDGIHSYLGVMNDFNWYSPSVKKGGIILFHDYFLYRDTIGMAVDEICNGGRVEKIEIIDSLFHKEVRTGMYVVTKL